MVTTEREMVNRFPDRSNENQRLERFTSLQPTYEDSLPDEDLVWDEQDDEYGS